MLDFDENPVIHLLSGDILNFVSYFIAILVSLDTFNIFYKTFVMNSQSSIGYLINKFKASCGAHVIKFMNKQNAAVN